MALNTVPFQHCCRDCYGSTQELTGFLQLMVTHAVLVLEPKAAFSLEQDNNEVLP